MLGLIPDYFDGGRSCSIYFNVLDGSRPYFQDAGLSSVYKDAGLVPNFELLELVPYQKPLDWFRVAGCYT